MTARAFTLEGSASVARRSGRAAPAGRRRASFDLLVLALAAFALLWHGIAVQTHVHIRAATIAAAPAAAVAPARIDGRRGTGDDPATCPLCRELAQSGSFLTPDAAAFVAPPPPADPAAGGPIREWAGRHVSHAWRNRGPPRLREPEA